MKSLLLFSTLLISMGSSTYSYAQHSQGDGPSNSGGNQSILAAETVKLRVAYPSGGCGAFKADLLKKMRSAMDTNRVDGRFTVISEVEQCNNVGGYVTPCACNLTVTLQESSYSLSTVIDRVKRTVKRETRDAALAQLESEIQNRDGYIWHHVEKAYVLIWKGYWVASLYMTKR